MCLFVITFFDFDFVFGSPDSFLRGFFILLVGACQAARSHDQLRRICLVALPTALVKPDSTPTQFCPSHLDASPPVLFSFYPLLSIHFLSGDQALTYLVASVGSQIITNFLHTFQLPFLPKERNHQLSS